MFKPFRYGVCYYPEAWDESKHARDIRRMKQAGFNVVRMGEGAWSYWEPTEGQFQFGLFDRVIDLCEKAGIAVILGTPTYAAPAWVSTTYPEVLRHDFRRLPMKHGGRRNFNYTSAKYLDLSDKLCSALAAHYRGNKNVIGWQLDNEFNCHMDVTYAPSDTVAFRAWCKDKYRTIDRLNAAWGASFWSQTYTDWSQIDLPHPTVAYNNPHALLDERRFISDCVIRFAERQAAILRRANPRWQITHNGLFDNVDPIALRGPIDFFSHDHYPIFWDGQHWTAFSSLSMQARSISMPYAIMEQQSGPGGQMTYLHRTPRPGEQRLWAWHSIANGASSLLWFRWRTCPYGSEQHWHGLLEPDDRDTRRLAEAKTLGKEIRSLPQAFYDSVPVRAAAVLRDYDCEVNDKRINTYNAEGQWEQHRYAAELQKQHVPCDMIWPSSDWAGYRLIIAPHLAIIPRALATKLRNFVTAGGVLVLGAQSGTMTPDLHLVDTPAPGLLRSLAGVEVDEWTTLPKGQSRVATFDDGSTVELNTIAEVLSLRGAKAIAAWSGDDTMLGNAPAVTQKTVGKGSVFYVAGCALESAVSALLPRWLKIARLKSVVTASDAVEVLDRRNGNQRFLCLLNHSTAPQTVSGLPAGRDLLRDMRVSDSLLLKPLGVTILKV